MKQIWRKAAVWISSLVLFFCLLLLTDMTAHAAYRYDSETRLSFRITNLVMEWKDERNEWGTSGSSIDEASLKKLADGKYQYRYRAALSSGGGTWWSDPVTVTFDGIDCEEEYYRAFHRTESTSAGGATMTWTYTLEVHRYKNHSYGDWSDNGDGTHSRTCRIHSTHVETQSHTREAATCMKAAYCKTCGYVDGDPAADAHRWGDWMPGEGDTHTHVCAWNSEHRESAGCSYEVATCTAPAECSGCHRTTGQPDAGNHTSSTFTYVQVSESLHHRYHTCCEASGGEEAHSFNLSGVCTGCRYQCTHTSGYTDSICNLCNIECPHGDFGEDGSCGICGKSGIPYTDRVWDEATATLLTFRRFAPSSAQSVTASTTSLSEGWYLVEGAVTISSRIQVSGTVHLILCDGADLHAAEGIRIEKKSALYLYAQSEGAAMGKLTALGGEEQAGIGGNYYGDVGSITITGGQITATGGKYGAGIGGGRSGKGGSIAITGGQITATGGVEGAGIGGGCSGLGGSITITGGQITATGGVEGAGIGGGVACSGESITIAGGQITATGGAYGAGIGGGNNGSGGSITIAGGEVTATGGAYGAGIGGGNGKYGGSITITGGQITATSRGSGAGIGGGRSGNGGTITITGGSVYAVGSDGASDIGPGKGKTSGTPTDGEGNTVYLNAITLPLAEEGTTVTGITGVAYGLRDVVTRDTNKLYFYLPLDTSAATITAGDVEYICNRNLIYDTVHEYKEATCIEPQTCIHCGHGIGEATAHSYVDDICTDCGMDRNGHFHIRTADQLMNFAAYVNMGHADADATLLADLDLEGYAWKPIAGTAMGETVTGGYTGSFDGNGYVIRHVSFSDAAAHTTAGIFGTVQSGGSVERLGVEHLTFQRGNTPDRRAGGIAGQLMAGGIIRDCYVTDSTIQVTGGVVGGIVGLNKGTVERCFTAGLTLDGYSQRFGGITGDYAGGSIINCHTSHAEIGSTASFVGTADGSEAGIGAERLASGEITYKLNGTDPERDPVWFQTIGTDPYPSFRGETVYAYQDTMGSGYFNTTHEHTWVYSREGTDTLRAECSGERCTLEDRSGGSVTLTAPADPSYTGSAVEAVVADSLETGDRVTVAYTGEGLVDGLPVKAGSYTAKITLGGQELSVAYTITHAVHSMEYHDITDTSHTAFCACGYQETESHDFRHDAAGHRCVCGKVEQYTITYTDGAEGLEVFADWVFTADYHAATPAFGSDPVRAGFLFAGWDPTLAETVTGDRTYTARWREKAAVVIREETQSYEFDGSPKAFAVSGTDLDGFAVEYMVEGSWTATAPSAAGSYRIRITREEDEVHKAFSLEIPEGLEIRKEAVTACPKDKTCLMYGYTDLNLEKWYHDGIHYCIEQGLMQGVGQNLFRPDGTTTRAMCVTILWRLEGSPVVDHAMDFSDVHADKWYTEAIRWAASKKIVEGYSNGSFGTEDNITREQMAAILYRYEKSRGGGFQGSWTFTMDYVDRDQVSVWAYEPMCWMNLNQIINGRPGKVLDPKGNATRAETAAILQRYCGVAGR